MGIFFIRPSFRFHWRAARNCFGMLPGTGSPLLSGTDLLDVEVVKEPQQLPPKGLRAMQAAAISRFSSLSKMPHPKF
jgi:hypothetical protein